VARGTARCRWRGSRPATSATSRSWASAFGASRVVVDEQLHGRRARVRFAAATLQPGRIDSFGPSAAPRSPSPRPPR
jgi:hypothetical protein